MAERIPSEEPLAPHIDDADLDTLISQTASRFRVGEILGARGVTTVALDESGRLRRYQPDGTSSLLE